jgi:hypothetical protein
VEADQDDSLWYLDSRATNHVFGCWRAFIDIDTSIHHIVKFGDGSEVTIEGSNTVVLKGKMGEHLPLMRVYYVPRLTSNIINLDQLDEEGYDIHMRGGILQIHNDKRRLVA